MIAPEEAWRRLLPHLAALGAESVPRRAAAGRVLAEPVAVRDDIPAATVSALDGFAFAGDLAAGVELPVAGTVAAGDAPGRELPAGTALRIFTGAPLPRGADRVVAVEATEVSAASNQRVRILRSPPADAAIRHRGEIARAGAALLPAGTELGAAALSLLAGQGIGEVAVHRAPRVAILATGDEVVAPDRAPRPGELRDSHTDFLLAAGRSLGLEIESLGIAPDEPRALAAAIERGLAFDVLIVCGGVSVGGRDGTGPAFARLGCATIFDGVAIQPGRHAVAASHSRGLVFGLPGNPASVMVCFWLFVRPAVRRLLGAADAFWNGAIRAALAGPVPGARGQDRFLPARVVTERGIAIATPIDVRGSHDAVAYARGPALLRVAAGAAPRVAGDLAELLLCDSTGVR